MRRIERCPRYGQLLAMLVLLLLILESSRFLLLVQSHAVHGREDGSLLNRSILMMLLLEVILAIHLTLAVEGDGRVFFVTVRDPRRCINRTQEFLVLIVAAAFWAFEV